jgi:hypothetical protein
MRILLSGYVNKPQFLCRPLLSPAKASTPR